MFELLTLFISWSFTNEKRREHFSPFTWQPLSGHPRLILQMIPTIKHELARNGITPVIGTNDRCAITSRKICKIWGN
jgi:hypothetical protein